METLPSRAWTARGLRRQGQVLPGGQHQVLVRRHGEAAAPHPQGHVAVEVDFGGTALCGAGQHGQDEISGLGVRGQEDRVAFPGRHQAAHGRLRGQGPQGGGHLEATAPGFLHRAALHEGLGVWV